MTNYPVLAAPVLAMALLVSGCGNDEAFNADFDTMKDSFRSALSTGKDDGNTQLTPETIGAMLASNPRPMMTVDIEDRIAGFVSLIEVNGAYRTFGNSARQAVIFRNGVLSGTRGMGADLMSTSIGTSGLIAARRNGQAMRVNRYLDGEGKTTEARFSCTVTVGESKSVGQGLVKGSGRLVTENCAATDGFKISNSYVVSGGGQVLWSRQWIGPDHGYAVIAPIRL